MSRYTLFAVIAALCLTISNAAVTTQALTSATFAHPPGVVIQGATGQTDVSTWGTYQSVIYGPGTANTTIYAYGLKGSAPITAVASRSLNASRLNNGTAATASTDALIADVVSGTVSYDTGYKTAVGLGSFAIVYVAADTATVPCNQVYLAVYTGGTAAAVTTKLTSATCALCTSTVAGAGFDYTIHNVFYENSTYYVAYTTETYVSTAGSTTACTGSASTAPSGLAADTTTTALSSTLQGYSVAGTAKWTTAPTWYTLAAATAPISTTVSGMCGPSNYSNSTTFYCAYSTATPAVISSIPITVATGVAGSAATIATSTAVSGSTAQTTKTYTIAGFLHSAYQQGILLNLLSTTYTAASTPVASTYANTLQLYNFTAEASSTTGATDGGIAITGFSNTAQTGVYAADGVTYGSGFGIIASYSDATTTYYQIAAFLANGTANGSAPAAFSQGAAGQASAFIDANGALWGGSYSVDSTSGIQTGWVGNLVGQLYNAGNVLVSFFTLLSLMIAALFAF